VRISAQATSFDGNSTAKMLGITLQDVFFIWRSQRIHLITLKNTHDAAIMKVQVSYQNSEGIEKSFIKEFKVGNPNTFISPEKNFSPDKLAAAVPFYWIPKNVLSKKFDPKKGAVSLWIRPRQDFKKASHIWLPPDTQTIFSLASLEGQAGDIPGRKAWGERNFLTVSTDDFRHIQVSIRDNTNQLRRILASLRGANDLWRHLHISWDCNYKGKTYLAIYLDGKKVSSEVSAGYSFQKLPNKAIKLVLDKPVFQFGIAANGLQRLNADIRDLHFYKEPCYSKSLAAAPERFSEAKAEAIFKLNNHWKQTAGNKSGAARPGCARYQ